MRAKEIIAIVFGSQALIGCSVWHAVVGGGEEPVRTTDDVVAEAEKADAEAAEKPAKLAKKPIKATQKDEHELKLARLWARVDELEEQSLRNKERIRVLEKGIMLGLVPEELKGSANKKTAPTIKAPLYETEPPVKPTEKQPEKSEKPKAEHDEAEDGKEPPADAASVVNKAENASYQAALASANELYRSGRYGRAIVEYDKIGKDFAGKVDGGMHKYWIGKCWSNLKEYNTARQILAEFVTEHASSPWLPRAKLELARVEWKAGMQDTALHRFKEIIQAYPYEDAAEMAKMELENLGKTL